MYIYIYTYIMLFEFGDLSKSGNSQNQKMIQS